MRLEEATAQAVAVLGRETMPRLRAEAADRLCTLAAEATPEQRPALAELVATLTSDTQEEVRAAGLALAALVHDSPSALAVLVRHLRDESAEVRLEAAGQLADLALPESRGALAAGLEDDDERVRFESARGMAALRHAAGREVLEAALDDEALRYRAASVLGELKDPASLPALKRAFGRWFLPAFDRTQLAFALATLGDAEGLRHLDRRARNRWAWDRPMALELLGQVRAPGALQVLKPAFASRDDEARGAAARGLGYLGGDEAEALLVAALEERTMSDDLKLDVAQGLWTLGTPGAREAVAALKLGDAAAQAELEALRAQPGSKP